MYKKLRINPLAVIFIPEIDKQNHYTTVAYNPDSEDLFLVDNIGYQVLKTIEENPDISLLELQKKLPGLSIDDQIDKFIKENIVKYE